MIDKSVFSDDDWRAIVDAPLRTEPGDVRRRRP